MTLWTLQPQNEAGAFFETLAPCEVLIELDWPLTFVVKRGALTFIAHFADEWEDTLRYIVSPTSEETLLDLKQGECTLRTALEQPIVWVVDCDHDWEVHQQEVVVPESLPDDVLPQAGVMLYPQLQPLLNVRLSGSAVPSSLIDASLVRSTFRYVQRAFTRVSKLVGRQLSANADKIIADAFDLRTQRLAFGSLEVAFREPPSEILEGEGATEEELLATREAISLAASLLARGLSWAADDDAESRALLGNPEDDRELLEAVTDLLPTVRRVKVELSGRAAIGRMTFDYRDTRRVKRHLKNLRDRLVYVESKGQIEELDIGRLAFTLRKTANESGEQRFSYTEEISDDVEAAFSGRMPVVVKGTRRVGAKTVQASAVDVFENGGLAPGDMPVPS